MANLTRYTQQLFGTSAGTNEMSEFGSLAAGAPSRYNGATITPALVQALSEFTSGWYSAVVGVNDPPIEDMNSLFYLAFYQLTYLFQKGIPEWDSGTTYYAGSLVQSSGTVYRSLTNSNTNNAVTDNTNWATLLQNGYLSVNAMSNNTTVASGQTLIWPNLTVNTSRTMTVDSGGYLEVANVLTVSGTLTVNGTVHVN